MAKNKAMYVRMDDEAIAEYRKMCEDRASTASAMTRKLIQDWIKKEKNKQREK
jgi:hypothetical protein